MRILLLILLPIGDTLFTTPAIHALRKRYPDAHITAFVYPTNAGILRSNPDIDELIFWPTRQTWPGFRHLIALFWGVRKARFDLAVEFCNYIWWVAFLGRNTPSGGYEFAPFLVDRAGRRPQVAQVPRSRTLPRPGQTSRRPGRRRVPAHLSHRRRRSARPGLVGQIQGRTGRAYSGYTPRRRGTVGAEAVGT